MLSFRVVSLLTPGEADNLVLNTPTGAWTLQRINNYSDVKSAISRGQVGETYYLEHPVSLTNQQAATQAFDELTPILLALTYLTGLSVTIERSSPASEISIMTPSDHWPRARGLHQSTFLVSSDSVLISATEAFVRSWTGVGTTEKTRLLIHHWIDALACWSLEDLYLSATTLLQVISATEADRQNRGLSFFSGLQGAAARSGIVSPSRDWIKMRNDLVHDGSLSASRFCNKSKQDCSAVAASAMNWIDDYIDTVHSLHCDVKPRFGASDFLGLKAYSLS